ncbi:MAG: hypothetical protein ACP5JL_09835, partial [bacterium]
MRKEGEGRTSESFRLLTSGLEKAAYVYDVDGTIKKGKETCFEQIAKLLALGLRQVIISGNYFAQQRARMNELVGLLKEKVKNPSDLNLILSRFALICDGAGTLAEFLGADSQNNPIIKIDEEFNQLNKIEEEDIRLWIKVIKEVLENTYIPAYQKNVNEKLDPEWLKNQGFPISLQLRGAENDPQTGLLANYLLDDNQYQERRFVLTWDTGRGMQDKSHQPNYSIPHTVQLAIAPIRSKYRGIIIHEILQKIDEKIRNGNVQYTRLRDNYDILYGGGANGWTIEIVKKGRHKGAALRYIIKKYNLSPSLVDYFGDEYYVVKEAEQIYLGYFNRLLGKNYTPDNIITTPGNDVVVCEVEGVKVNA